LKTLIVTGAAGFIGCNFVRLALSRGYRVIGFDALTYAGHRENLADVKGEFELVVGDIRDAKAVASIFTKYKPSAFLNFAAESHVDRSIAEPLVFVETNVMGTANLLVNSVEYWKTNKDFRYLQVSTDEVYGALGETGKFSETTPVNPHSPYSASKTGADHLVHAWQNTYGLPTITTRCSNNYGPYQYPEKLIPHLLNCAIAGKPLPVYGDGRNVRDWIHVEDHCEGILAALEKGKAGETYCLGGNAERRNIDLVKQMCAELDKLSPRKDGKLYGEQIAFVKDRAGHDFRYAIDDTYAAKEIGFIRKHTFDSGLRQTIEWYLAHEGWSAQVLKGKS
jgi:dTDP-glucose 4,6-dehydratase